MRDHGMLLRTEQADEDLQGPFRALDDSTSKSAPARYSACSAPTAPARRRHCACSWASCGRRAGHAFIAGHDCWHDSVAARRHVAYLPGELRLYENMTGRQLVQFLCDLRGQTVNAELDDLARRFDIDLDRPIANLSSGMKRKVALLAGASHRTRR